MLFAYRATSVTALTSIYAALSYARAEGHKVDLKLYGNALIHAARNKALATVADADFALMIDDDMVPEPDAIARLVARDQPVISALCTTRVPPVQLAVRVHDPASDQFAYVEALRPDTLAKGPFAVGTACLLVRRDVIGSLTEYYLSASDWLAENRRLLDRLRVRGDLREKERARREQIRRANWEKDRALRVFDFITGENEHQYGEDITFARKLIALQVPVVIDTSVKVGHLGEHAYGVWDLDYDNG